MKVIFYARKYLFKTEKMHLKVLQLLYEHSKFSVWNSSACSDSLSFEMTENEDL